MLSSAVECLCKLVRITSGSFQKVSRNSWGVLPDAGENISRRQVEALGAVPKCFRTTGNVSGQRNNLPDRCEHASAQCACFPECSLKRFRIVENYVRWRPIPVVNTTGGETAVVHSILGKLLVGEASRVETLICTLLL